MKFRKKIFRTFARKTGKRIARRKAGRRRPGRTGKFARAAFRRRRGAAGRQPVPADWINEAYGAGSGEGSKHSQWDGQNFKLHLNHIWHRWMSVNMPPRADWQSYHQAALRFIEGYCNTAGLFPRSDWVLLPTAKTVSAIVTVMNEERTIPSVLEQLNRLPLHEIIFVVNGSTDHSFQMIRGFSSSLIVHYPNRLGHDVGRSIGAKLSSADVLLFLDGDFPVFAEHTIPFLHAIEQGYDIALNDISPYIGLFRDRDPVTIMKEFLNKVLHRTDLQANSLTAVPHAMSRQAAEAIGYENLLVPPKAQVIAIHKGLSIAAPMSVDVITPNKIRAINEGLSSPVSEMIVGDHIEALHYAMDQQGQRLAFQDSIRQRAYAEAVPS